MSDFNGATPKHAIRSKALRLSSLCFSYDWIVLSWNILEYVRRQSETVGSSHEKVWWMNELG